MRGARNTQQPRAGAFRARRPRFVTSSGVLWVLTGVALLGFGGSRMRPITRALPATPCAVAPDGELAPSRDLYCVELVAMPGLTGITATLELGRIPSPFTVNVTPDGRHVYDAILTVRGLPAPETLGEYTTYVAWLVTPMLAPIANLGEVRNGVNQLPPIDLNKFLIFVSGEPRPDGEERSGRLVLRGSSPSTRMQPPDLMEFMFGATQLDSAGTMHMGAAPGGWVRPPMPAGIGTLAALMQLDPPDVRPYLPPGGSAGTTVDARPRELVRMEDGDTLKLDAMFVRRTIRGKQFTMYGFNGQYPGPLIWVPQDATIIVNFSNHIDWPTTVHWHGVRLDNRFDGVPGLTQDPVPPGGSFQYRIHFPDAGIYWYHPHHREDVQQDLGLYGNMMVRSPRADYFSPAHREEVLMLDDLLMSDDGIVPYGREAASHAMMGRFGNLFLVNGEPDYALDTDRGEVVRFFLTNVSNTRTFNLSFGGAPMKVVGSDVGNYEREVWVQSVVIAPAERYIIHVRFPSAGRYPLVNRVQAIDHLNGRFFPQVDTLGVIRTSDRPVGIDHADSFGALREDVAATASIDPYREHFDRPVDRELILTMETENLPFVVERLMRFDSTYFHPVEWAGTMPMMNWASTPNQVRWILRDPATGNEDMDIDWQFRVGDVVKIRLANLREAFHAMSHPIHIHGQRFLILEENGVANDNLVWKDTMLLPVGSTADILLELTNPGRWMLHCHIAEHLESGMMMAFTVN